ncbi:MAG TPA: DUF2252 domain-containing protein [Candidatus Coprovicinus avistercoris]|uniref:DUF2252 domain-containing protein n=1 Tax=Candidatus Coprovicinus avistercoris TaxID=2840754 RepID=A0A9D1HY66_9ACTN|nr:DUF2252 domain-containing protein [Candidatus Coprovicinus avistercoris]
MDGFEEVEKNATPSSQAILYSPAPTVEERLGAGVAARKTCPIASLGSWELRSSSTPAIDLIEQQSATRDPSLLPLRYKRMGVSPFTFYRGSAVIMAADLATMPVTGFEVQCIGDAHIGNFGVFMSRTRHLVFDINDFDETAPGPWEWDLMRLVTSVEICGRDRSFSKGERKDAVRACAKQYRRAMASFAEMGEMDVWLTHLDVEKTLDEIELDGKKGRGVRRALRQAYEKDSVRAANKLALRDGGRLRFDSRPPELVPLAELSAEQGYDAAQLSHMLHDLLDAYFENLPRDCRSLLGRYRLRDVARKVVGVGSVGRRAWIALLTGRDDDDPLILQIKEAEESVVELYWRPSDFASHSERVVEGQRLVQSTSDFLLGWTSTAAVNGTARDYYVRQLWNGKGSIDLAALDPESLENTARLCAWSLAHAHARTGDAVAIASYLNDGHTLEDAMWDFARSYADQNEADYQAFCKRFLPGETT